MRAAMQNRKWIVIIAVALLALTACDGGDGATPTPQVLQPVQQATPVGYPAPAEPTVIVVPEGYPSPVSFPTPTLPEGYAAPSP